MNFHSPMNADNDQIKQPSLLTQRLILRPFLLSDVAQVCVLAGDATIARMTEMVPHPYTQEDAQIWISGQPKAFAEGRGPTWAICHKGSGQLMGAIGLAIRLRDQTGVLGYWLGRPFWRQGYTLESAVAVLGWAQNHCLPRLSASVLADNVGSTHILQRLGFLREGILRKDVLRDGQRLDRHYYGLLLDDEGTGSEAEVT